MKIPDMHTNYVLKFKALSEPTRLKMIAHLSEPHTVKQVADILEIDHHALYHHMHVLEKSGIVELVKTRTIGNITEKYFKLTDNWIMMPQSPHGATDLSDSDPVMRQVVFAMIEDLTEAIRTEKDSGAIERLIINFKTENLGDKLSKLNALIQAFIDDVEKLDNEGGDISYSVNLLHFKRHRTDFLPKSE
ncbi:helix-turn-helix domain-containing protein [bacterium]|nr:helix-turn-helix domain-containing protein [bacterium]MBU1024635.1 helix-turn-helix domain-containing protein [bacterium]